MKTESYPKMHVSLYVSDLQKTMEFYNLFFDLLPLKEKSDYLKYELSKPSLVISFIQNPDKVRSDFGHLGFQVASKEDLNSRIQRISQLGLKSVEEKATACCYAIQDKIWVSDPDGTQWEVYYFHDDVEFNDPRYEKEDVAICCTPPKKKLNLADIGQPCC